MTQHFLMIDRKLMLVTVCPYSGTLPRNTRRHCYHLLDSREDGYVATALRKQKRTNVLSVHSLANKTWFIKIVEKLTGGKR